MVFGWGQAKNVVAALRPEIEERRKTQTVAQIYRDMRAEGKITISRTAFFKYLQDSPRSTDSVSKSSLKIQKANPQKANPKPSAQVRPAAPATSSMSAENSLTKGFQWNPENKLEDW